MNTVTEDLEVAEYELKRLRELLLDVRAVLETDMDTGLKVRSALILLAGVDQ
jgi:hypothetical protein